MGTRLYMLRRLPLRVASIELHRPFARIRPTALILRGSEISRSTVCFVHTITTSGTSGLDGLTIAVGSIECRSLDHETASDIRDQRVHVSYRSVSASVWSVWMLSSRVPGTFDMVG